MAAALGLALDLPEEVAHCGVSYINWVCSLLRFLSNAYLSLFWEMWIELCEFWNSRNKIWSWNYLTLCHHLPCEERKREGGAFLVFVSLGFLWSCLSVISLALLYFLTSFHPNPSPNQLDCILSSVFKQITVWVLSLMFIKISPKTGLKSCSFVDQANPIIGWTFKPWKKLMIDCRPSQVCKLWQKVFFIPL